MGQGKLRFAPLGPHRIGRGPEAHPESCNWGSVMPTVAPACPWVGGAKSAFSVLPAPEHAVHAQFMVCHPLLAKKRTCGRAGIGDCSSGSETAHNPWSKSLRTCYLWVRRTPRQLGVRIPCGTNRSAWPQGGCGSNAHSPRSHSHRSAGRFCLRTEGDSLRGAFAGQGKPALVATPPWARASVLHEGMFSFNYRD